jgi:predicted RNase H-like HicB family nuclease
MLRHFTLEYWIDESWYVGRLREVPRVFSQGESLEELEDPQTAIMAKELGVEA